MADWFKLYENDLENELLQWAMSEQQPVAIVYVTILSRCCRDKSGTLPWTGQDFELFALARSVHITPPIANECLKLLEKIRYIEIKDGTLKALHWNTRQSEYCQKRVKVSRQCPDSVPTFDGNCPSRGEERRGDQISLSVELPPRFPKTEDEAKNIAGFACITPELAVHVWNKAMARGGRDSKGVPIVDFARYLATEKKYELDRKEREKHGNNNHNHKPNRGPSRTEGTYNANAKSLEHLVK